MCVLQLLSKNPSVDLCDSQDSVYNNDCKCLQWVQQARDYTKPLKVLELEESKKKGRTLRLPHSGTAEKLLALLRFAMQRSIRDITTKFSCDEHREPLGAENLEHKIRPRHFQDSSHTQLPLERKESRERRTRGGVI